MAKTLFVIDDDDFQNLPDLARTKLRSEVANLFSFIPQFNVVARRPDQLPAILHFTDSVVMLVESNAAVDAVLPHIQQKQNDNVRFSIKQAGVHLDLDKLSPSFAGAPDKGGVGGQWKTVVPDGARTKVSISMTYGVASLEFAEDAFLDDLLHKRKADDIRREQREHQRKDSNWLKTKEGQQSTRDLVEAELLSQHKPLKDWPRNQWEDIATALARIVAHEARHQYILDPEHSSAGLGAESATVWGDPNFVAFEGHDQANILARIDTLDRNWNTASVHLETCPAQKTSPFA